MALERIDPRVRQDKWVLDHYARYLFALPLAPNRRILDIACGTGYGSRLLAEEQALDVVGIDNSYDAIAYAIEHYHHTQITYRQQDILSLNTIENGTFDLIVCFETLEHIMQPEAALEVLAHLLRPEGIMIVSIPNDRELKPDNPYHLHIFTQQEFLNLLQSRFEFVLPYYQNCLQSSMVWRPSDDTSSSVHSDKEALYMLQAAVFHYGSNREDAEHPDCFLAVCTNVAEIGLPPIIVQSGAVWRHYLATEAGPLWAEVQRLGQNWEQQKAYIDSQHAYIGQLEQERDRLWAELQQLGQSWEQQKAYIGQLEQERKRDSAEQ